MTESPTLAFDLYGTLVDPIGISTALKSLVGASKSGEVASLWRQRQLEYSFRLTAMNRYEDFRWVTERSLHDVLTLLAVDLSMVERDGLIEAYDHLEPFSEVPSGLARLKAQGYVLAVFSNGTPEMISACLSNSGLDDVFEAQISVAGSRCFKPSPRAYAHASEQLACPISEIRLISSNPFDVIGSKNAGMKNAWINRSGAAFETLADGPDLQVSGIDALCEALTT